MEDVIKFKNGKELSADDYKLLSME